MNEILDFGSRQRSLTSPADLNLFGGGIAAGTTIIVQISGTPGGAGVYQPSAVQPAASGEFEATPYAGDITLFGDSGVSAARGGAIEALSPGGGLALGLANTPPPAPDYGETPAGPATFGSGDVNVYNEGTMFAHRGRHRIEYHAGR